VVASTSALPQGRSLARLSINDCKVFFWSARPNCHVPKAAVTNTTTAVVVVNTTARQLTFCMPNTPVEKDADN
jgi:hypothetical protein